MSAALDIRVADVLTAQPTSDVVEGLRARGLELVPSPANAAHLVVVHASAGRAPVDRTWVAMSVASRVIEAHEVGGTDATILTRALDGVALDLEGSLGVRGAQRYVQRRDVAALARAALDFAAAGEA